MAADRRPSPLAALDPLRRQVTGKVGALLEPMLATRIEGFLERFIADEAVGWAIDGRRPGRRVLVVALLGKTVIGESLADQRRQDLESVGKGDGRCGFRLKLPADLSVEDKAALIFEGRAGWRREALRRTKRFRLEAPASAAPPPPETPRAPTGGFLERFSSGVLKGWAVNPNHPEEPANVDIFQDERYIGSTRAEIDRPRLRSTGAPFGARGFEFKPRPGVVTAPDRLRARIAGPRIDLRRSRSYAADEPASEERDPRAGADKAVAVVETRPVSDKVLMIVCGAGSAQQVETTLASCRAQTGADAAWTHVAAGGRIPEGGRHDETQALRDMVQAARWAVFLAPGQTVAPDLAQRLIRMEAPADVLCWDGPAGASLGADPDLAVRLGAWPCGLAIRVRAMLDPAGGLAMGLPSGGLAQVGAWAGGSGLVWTRLDGLFVDAPPGGGRGNPDSETDPRRTPAAPRWLSLAVWTGWEAGPPPALKALMGAAGGFDVEVLAPSTAAEGLLATLRDWLAPDARSLSLRLVDEPEGLDEGGLRRAMGQAACGQAVLFCEGAVAPPPGALADAVAWSRQPGVGGVTIALSAGKGRPVLAGLQPDSSGPGAAATSAFDAALAGRDRPVPAAPTAFMAISRAALAEVGGLPVGRAARDAAAELDLGLRLRRAGRRSVLLGRHQGQAPDTLLGRWTPPPGAAGA